MNVYQFVNRARVSAPTAENIANAQSVSSVDEFLAVSAKAGEYVFTDKADENAFKGSTKALEFAKALQAVAVSVRIWCEKSTTGDTLRRGEITASNGRKYPVRLYGVKDTPVFDETTLAGDDLKKIIFGVCYQDGRLVDEMKSVGGICKTYPVIYLKF